MIEAALLLPLAKLPLDVCPVTSVTNHSRGPARTDGVRSSEGSAGQLNSASRRPGPQPERLKWGQWLDIWQLEPSGGFFTHMSGAWTQLTEAGLSLGLLTGAPVCVLSRGLGLPGGNVRKERSSDPVTAARAFSDRVSQLLSHCILLAPVPQPRSTGVWRGPTAEQEGRELLPQRSQKAQSAARWPGQGSLHLGLSPWFSGKKVFKKESRSQDRQL